MMQAKTKLVLPLDKSSTTRDKKSETSRLRAQNVVLGVGSTRSTGRPQRHRREALETQ